MRVANGRVYARMQRVHVGCSVGAYRMGLGSVGVHVWGEGGLGLFLLYFRPCGLSWLRGRGLCAALPYSFSSGASFHGGHLRFASQHEVVCSMSDRRLRQEKRYSFYWFRI